jgi:hypothetical protein
MLPLTPKLLLIISDAFIVWSVLILRNDDVSVFAEFNANDAVNELIAYVILSIPKGPSTPVDKM